MYLNVVGLSTSDDNDNGSVVGSTTISACSTMEDLELNDPSLDYFDEPLTADEITQDSSTHGGWRFQREKEHQA